MKLKAVPVTDLLDATVNFEQIQLRAILDSTPQSFLQLATAATRKIAVGAATVTWPGASNSSTALVVTHGLGTTPVVALACSSDGGIYCNTSALGSTTFTVTGQDPFGQPAVAHTSGIFWIAIG